MTPRKGDGWLEVARNNKKTQSNPLLGQSWTSIDWEVEKPASGVKFTTGQECKFEKWCALRIPRKLMAWNSLDGISFLNPIVRWLNFLLQCLTGGSVSTVLFSRFISNGSSKSWWKLVHDSAINVFVVFTMDLVEVTTDPSGTSCRTTFVASQLRNFLSEVLCTSIKLLSAIRVIHPPQRHPTTSSHIFLGKVVIRTASQTILTESEFSLNHDAIKHSTAQAERRLHALEAASWLFRLDVFVCTRRRFSWEISFP